MIVTRFGVHWAPGGIPFLVQSFDAQNLISPDLTSPFVVKVRPRKLLCPHRIDLSITAKADWIQDPLAQAFLPTPRIPGEMAKLILDPDRKLEQLFVQLSRLCSPTDTLLRPLWWSPPGKMTSMYAITNLTPMVFIGGSINDMRDVHRHIRLAEASNRRLIILTRQPLPVFDEDWITTDLTDVSAEPLEAIGAGVLREYMLNAQP